MIFGNIFHLHVSNSAQRDDRGCQLPVGSTSALNLREVSLKAWAERLGFQYFIPFMVKIGKEKKKRKRRGHVTDTNK